MALFLSRRYGTFLDRLVVALSPTSAAPGWFYGLFLILFFAAIWGVLPYGGMVAVSYTHLDVYKRQDREGFNQAGYDREGYNRDGFNEAGYNSEGFDKEGFDQAGFDAEGFDKEGYNQEGFNKEGYDKAGYDKERCV